MLYCTFVEKLFNIINLNDREDIEDMSFDTVMADVVGSVQGTGKRLFVGISNEWSIDQLGAFANTQGECWILRTENKSILFICGDDRDDFMSYHHALGECELYITNVMGTLLPLGVTDERVIRPLSDVRDNVHVLERIPEPLYGEGERVQCHGYFGVVSGVGWAYHQRGGMFCWRYAIEWEDERPNLSIVHLPEGYLQKEDASSPEQVYA